MDSQQEQKFLGMLVFICREKGWTWSEKASLCVDLRRRYIRVRRVQYSGQVVAGTSYTLTDTSQNCLALWEAGLNSTSGSPLLIIGQSTLPLLPLLPPCFVPPAETLVVSERSESRDHSWNSSPEYWSIFGNWDTLTLNLNLNLTRDAILK